MKVRAALFLLAAAIFLAGIGRTALKDPDEGRNAEVAREMAASGDLVTPTINGARYLDKPPAYFWAVAASIRLFGANEFAARFPSALFGLAGVALVLWFARRHLSERAGLYASAALVLSPLYIVFARTVIFDMMLTFFMTTSVCAAFEAMEGEGRSARRAGLLFFAAAGAGTITKGPIALILPLLVAVAWALLERKPRALARLRFGAGFLVYALVVAPWVVLVSIQNPGYLEYAIVGENLKRVAGNTMETDRPVHFYLRVVLPGMFPWIICAGAALARRSAGALAERFAVVWAGAIFVFFSLLSGKRPSYMLPMAVPIAILAGSRFAAADGDDASARRDLSAGGLIVAIACAALGAAAFALGPLSLLPRPGGGLYDPILSRGALLGGTGAGLLVAAFLAAAARRGRRPARAFAAAAIGVLVMVPLAGAVADYNERDRSSRPISRFLLPRIGPADAVLCFDEYRPGLNFYLRRPIYLVSKPGRTFTSNYIKMHIEEYRRDPSFRQIPDERMRQMIAGPGTVFIVVPKRSYEDLRARAGAPLAAIHEDRVGAIFVRADLAERFSPPAGTPPAP